MSNILYDAKKIISTHLAMQSFGKQKVITEEEAYPKTHKERVEHLHTNIPTDNAIQHKMIEMVYISLFYKTWADYKKTYIVDKDFFNSLTKAKQIKIYPDILKTLPFDTFSIDLSGNDLFNGYILCSFDLDERNPYDLDLYFSFLAHDYDTNNDKMFGVYINSEDMSVDDNGGLYYNLSKDEEDKDNTFFRAPSSKSSIAQRLKKVMPVEDEDEIFEIEEEYFEKINNINNDKKWFLLKKALIQFAYYLCTPKPDVYESKETKKEVKRTQRKKKNLDDIEYKYVVGSRAGARIKLGNTITNDIGQKVEYKKGTMKCPHVRAAHWHHYWYGSGSDKHVEAVYVDVTFINFELGNIDEVYNEVSDKVKKEWKNEKMICQILDSLKIKYKRQSPVVIDGHRYRFDVEVMINNKKAYIEYDGEQHFYPVSVFGGEEGHKKTREADLIKNKYCTDNDIPLLRIPYIKQNNINELVKSFINNPYENSTSLLLYYNIA